MILIAARKRIFSQVNQISVTNLNQIAIFASSVKIQAFLPKTLMSRNFVLLENSDRSVLLKVENLPFVNLDKEIAWVDLSSETAPAEII